MDFFHHQERARRHTLLLLIYFAVAVVVVVVAVNLGSWLFTRWFVIPYDLNGWLHSRACLWVTLATLAVIAFGSSRRSWQLRDGGDGLARLVGAEEVPAGVRNPTARRLRNVVEEMSIAAGVPAPRTWVLPREHRINAFAAGLTPSRSALVVTRGALERLDRDELQGVVAHEFGHILNADMRLNLRLVAILAGITELGKLGRYLLFADDDDRRNQRGVFALGGVILIAAGALGLFLGRVIKAAISRQRELLADASAVQFTRQADGLAGALIKIRNGEGSHLRSPHAEDVSHMGFAETLPSALSRLLATHPDLDQRLRGLGAGWAARARVRARQGKPATAPARGDAVHSQRIGHLDDANLGYARSLMSAIPEPLHQALDTVEGSECVLYALILGPLTPPPALREGRRGELVSLVREQGTRLRLPLLDLALPRLRHLPAERRRVIERQLHGIAAHRHDADLFCWALTAIAGKALVPPKRNPAAPGINRLNAVAGELQVLFSALAWAGDSAHATALAGFQRATHGLLPPGRLLLPPDRCGAERLDAAVKRLNRLSPLLKAPVIDAAGDLVLADGLVQVAEAELLRALCALLECPMPPLFHQRATPAAP